MATLNLRISNKELGTTPVKKIKTSISIPSNNRSFYYFMKKELQADESDPTLMKLFDFTTEDQLLGQLEAYNLKVYNKEVAMKFVSVFYLMADFQSHLKKAAQKMLEVSSASSSDILVSKLIIFLSMAANLEDQGYAAGTLMHLSKSSLCPSVVLHCWDDIIQFLILAINAHFQYLNRPETRAPIEQHNVFTGLHHLCQATVAILAHRKQNCCDISLQHSLSSVLANPPAQLPSDTQNTCAIALAVATGLEGGMSPLLWPALALHPPHLHSICLKNCSTSIRVSLCMALIKVMPADSLMKPTPVHIATCPQTVLESMVDFLITHTSKSTEPKLLLSATRALAELGRMFKSFENRRYVLDLLLDPLLHHCLSLLEHHMDSVRHAAELLLHSLVSEAQGTDAELRVLSTIRNLPLDSKVRILGVAKLGSIIGIHRVLIEFPNLVPWLLDALQDFTTCCHAKITFQGLMDLDTQSSTEVWCDRWLRPILLRLPSSPVEFGILYAVRKRPETLHVVLQAFIPPDKDEENVEESTSKLKVVLGCLKVAMESGLLKCDSDEKLWRGVLSWKSLEIAVGHADDEVRLEALRLLVYSRKTTEPLSARELQLLLRGLVDTGDSYAPKTLYNSIGLVKKLLTRLESSLKNLQKLDKPFQHYFDFLTNLCKAMFHSLFPTASLGRRSFALHVLSLIRDESISEPCSTAWKSQLSKKHGQTLLDCLPDSYGQNKQMGLSLLLNFPAHLLNLDSHKEVETLLLYCFKLSESWVPSYSVTAAYALSLILNTPDCHSVLHSYQIVRNGVPLSECSATLKMCEILLERLELQAKRDNVLKIVTEGPLYGTLFCLRHILSETHLSSLSELKDGQSWKKFVERLVDMCFNINIAMGKVVNSAAPEGYFPMDLADYRACFDPKKEKSLVEIPDDNEEFVVTPQMILLCSWRCVKEASLILGELAARIPPNETSYLLSTKQLIAIGEHLTALLCETKHRGAFEQAYIAFCRLCAWLWRVPSGTLPQMPSKWLDEVLAAIASEEQGSTGTGLRLSNKLCVTRRSAGLPFILQALLTTELKVRERPECFQKAMMRLLALAAKLGGSGQIHALNILHALFRSAQLGEHVAPHVGEGFNVAMQAFQKINWAVTNAATLLFSALMNRVFGVKHTPGHEALPRKNRMTGRIFFRLYPSMYELLERELKLAAEHMKENNIDSTLIPSLHPTLLLLGRLYPSSLEGTDTSLNLLSLRENVMKCAASPVMQTRVLAARALVPLVDPDSLPEFVASLSLTNSLTHNQLHGTLLQLMLLVEGAQYSEELTQVLRAKIIEGMPLLQSSHVCAVTKAAFIDILHVVVIRHRSAITSDTSATLRSHLEIILYTPACIGYSVLKGKAAKVLLHLATDPEVTLLSILRHPLSSVLHEAFIFLLSLTSDKGEIRGDAAEILNLPDVFSKHGSLKNAEAISTVLFQLTVEYCLVDGQAVEFETRVAMCWCLSRLATALLQVEESSTMPGMIKRVFMLLELHGRLGSADHMLLACCGELINALPSDPPHDLMSVYCNLLLQSSGMDCSSGSRLVAAQSLCRNSQRLFSADSRTICQAHCVAMRLLQDCNESVRRSVAQLWPAVRRVVHTEAERLVANHLVDMMDLTQPQEVLSTLLQWAFGDVLFPATNIADENGIVENDMEAQEDTEKSLSKGDAALSPEELKVTEAACDALKYFLIKISKDNITECLKRPIIWLPLCHVPDKSFTWKELCTLNVPLPHFLDPHYPKVALFHWRQHYVNCTDILSYF